MPNLREKTWTPTTPAKTEDANFWEDHLIDDESYEGLQNLLEGGGAGHEIQDADGNTMPQQPVIQFINAEVTNGTGKTIVSGNGEKGDAGTIEVGTVTTGAPGSPVEITNTGTPSAAVLNFTIPRGLDGTGSVTKVNNVSPDGDGNVALTAANVPLTALGISATNTQAAVAESYDKTVTHYFNTTLGSATATSDSTVYSGGYKLTLTNATVTTSSTVSVFFPQGDYSGNLTWETSAGKIELYFDQNPNSKQIRVEWKQTALSTSSVS